MSADLGHATARRETDKALLCRVDDLDQEVWIPKGQIDDDSEVCAIGHSGRLVVSDWLAERNGWV